MTLVSKKSSVDQSELGSVRLSGELYVSVRISIWSTTLNQ